MDFDNLVLSPCMAAFGVTVLVTPLKSQPSAQPYTAEGIYDRSVATVMLADGSEMASTNVTLGIRLSDFSIPPREGDKITLNGKAYKVDALFPDGQGGAELKLKEIR
jgi:hypothetical protein